jgi:hypothetical protein
MRVLFILSGVGLLLLAAAGAVVWVRGFEMLKQLLVEGVPFFWEFENGRQLHLSGRLVSAFAIAVPVACALGGGWLIRLGVVREERHNA